MRPRRFKVFGEGSSKQPGQYEGRATSLHGAQRIQKQAALECGRRPDHYVSRRRGLFSGGDTEFGDQLESYFAF